MRFLAFSFLLKLHRVNLHPGPDQLTKSMTNVHVIQYQSNEMNTTIIHYY